VSRPTRRELEALAAVCQPGGSVASAARDLGISPHTVRSYLSRLYQRLGVASAAQAAWQVWADGIPAGRP
jgi:DNA-binding NarL/FixJ family response regulator